MGGDSALAFAETLNAENIPVSLLVTYDPSRIADDVPPNVERYINIFQSSNFMGGGNVVQGQRFHGHYASFNLKDHTEIIHINIEKADRIQEQLVAKVKELAATPATAEGEAVPLRLEVPADAAIELWDSGLPVAAHAGDTLKTIRRDLSRAAVVAHADQFRVGSRAAHRRPAHRHSAPSGADGGANARARRYKLRAGQPLIVRLAMRREAKPARLEAAPERHRRRFAVDADIHRAPIERIAIGNAAVGRLARRRRTPLSSHASPPARAINDATP